MPAQSDKYTNGNGLGYLWGRIKVLIDNKIINKVDKETGKGLSTNDYTSEDKTKLTGISAGAQVNTIETIAVNGTVVAPDANKKVSITTPTKTSDLNNDSDFQTGTEVSTAIDEAIAGITGIEFNFDYDTVSELPRPGAAGTIYFIPDQSCFEATTDTEFEEGKKYFEKNLLDQYVPTTDTEMVSGKTYYTLKTGLNTYDEYVWSIAKISYEMFGSAAIDTTTFWSKSELVALTTAEIDALTPYTSA